MRSIIAITSYFCLLILQSKSSIGLSSSRRVLRDVISRLQRPAVVGSRRMPSLSVLFSTASTRDPSTDATVTSSDQLLYEEQEKLLVNRGAIEANLMLNTGSPITTIIQKGAGAAKGFAASSGMSSSDIKTSAKNFGKELRKMGVVRIDNVLPNEIADELRNYVFNLRTESETLVEEGKVKPLARFANVLLKKNRCDLTIPLEEDDVVDALLHVLQKSPVGKLISINLGKDPSLYELSCLISDSGSQRQTVHPDTPCSSGSDADVVLYTCFIALQSITLEMGPTTWIPKTHTAAKHAVFKDDQLDVTIGESPKDKLLRTSPSVLGLLPKGSCAIFDSRLLHCGGSNISNDKTRALFYFSFKNTGVGYPGNPASIRPEIHSKYTLKTLEAELKKVKKAR